MSRRVNMNVDGLFSCQISSISSYRGSRQIPRGTRSQFMQKNVYWLNIQKYEKKKKRVSSRSALDRGLHSDSENFFLKKNGKEYLTASCFWRGHRKAKYLVCLSILVYRLIWEFLDMELHWMWMVLFDIINSLIVVDCLIWYYLNWDLYVIVEIYCRH